MTITLLMHCESCDLSVTRKLLEGINGVANELFKERKIVSNKTRVVIEIDQ